MAQRHGRGFTLIEVMIVVSIIGILAVVAGASFIRYMRRAKTIEATQNLEKLWKASFAYYLTEHANTSQTIIGRQFPDSMAETPGINACCGNPGDKCDPLAVASKWKVATWDALNFSVDDPFYFWYRYDSAGTDTVANFSAWAFGNLDCDTNYSTFLRGGHVDALGNPSGPGGLYVRNEVE